MAGWGAVGGRGAVVVAGLGDGRLRASAEVLECWIAAWRDATLVPKIAMHSVAAGELSRQRVRRRGRCGTG